MNIEEAIKTAIEYEEKVTAFYGGAVDKVSDPVGQKVLKVLADEERQHVDYLRAKLEEWRKTGKVTAEELKTVVPAKEKIDEEIKKLKMSTPGKATRGIEVELLQQALEVEVETSDYYKRMVNEMPEEGRALFAAFLEIEEGHKTIVQAEMDSVRGLGFWFDFREFDLEAG